MWVLAIYVILMLAGDLIDYLVGAFVSDTWGDPVSLPVFLFCYFATLWIAWVLAVKIAEKMRLYT
jgi:hypothetical protein